MRKIACITVASALLAILICAWPAQAAPEQNLAIGVRVKSWELLGDKNFTGSITDNTVAEKDQLYPTNINMLYLLSDYAGLSLEWDRFGATMEKDGHLDWDTFTLAANFRYPVNLGGLKTAPYVLLGLTYTTTKFDENNWWRYGWNSQDDYNTAQRNRPAGADPDKYLLTGRTRDMAVDDSVGWVYGLGVDFFLTKNLALNLDARWNRTSVNAHYSIVSDDGMDTFLKRDFDYSLDTVSYSIGFRWYF